MTGALATNALASSNSSLPIVPPLPTTPQNTLGPDPYWPARLDGAIYMGDFAAPKIANIKCALIGVGQRGSCHAVQLAQIGVMTKGIEVVAIADINAKAAESSANAVKEKTGKLPKIYTDGDLDYQRMLKEVKPDMVVISSPWRWHARHAVDSMKAGAHAFVEVPLAMNPMELWEVINVSESTKKHCMMMENCNYGREELLYLNMVRKNLIGDLLHGEAAYIHDLRFQMLNGDTCGSWRTEHYIRRDCNIYPTHGLGPVAQYMDLARGSDMFARLTSFGSPSLGRPAFAKNNVDKLTDKKWSEAQFLCSDMSTSIIKTCKGRTIVVQWDETSPRPYSRHNLIQGTEGILAGYPTRVAGTKLGDGNYHKWIEGKGMDAIYEKYEHPLWKRMGDVAQKMGGHGGMDFIMLYRMAECLNQGVALDQNVYEGALWSVVATLSEDSVRNGGIPREFPDFTRGDWTKTKPLGIVD